MQLLLGDRRHTQLTMHDDTQHTSELSVYVDGCVLPDK